MSIGSAIVNQALSRGAGQLKKVMGNLPGAALSGSKSAFGGSLTRAPSIHLQYPMNVENDIQQGHYIMFFINSSEPAVIKKAKAAKEAAEILAASNAAAEMGAGYGGPPARPAAAGCHLHANPTHCEDAAKCWPNISNWAALQMPEFPYRTIAKCGGRYFPMQYCREC